MPMQTDRHSDQQRRTGRTLIELTEREDGTWVATQPDIDVEGTGETGALAAMDYCRAIAQREPGPAASDQ